MIYCVCIRSKKKLWCMSGWGTSGRYQASSSLPSDLWGGVDFSFLFFIFTKCLKCYTIKKYQAPLKPIHYFILHQENKIRYPANATGSDRHLVTLYAPLMCSCPPSSSHMEDRLNVCRFIPHRAMLPRWTTLRWLPSFPLPYRTKRMCCSGTCRRSTSSTKRERHLMEPRFHLALN